ncbi:MAG: TetR/AcrR family transcriptional regulator [Rhizobiales bacterium]|nr:TetR/AcrR family transcriptional regulator [Hyphomicrobiales bacterium]
MGTKSTMKPPAKPARDKPASEFAPARPDVRDEEILRAALEVFSEKGFHGATMLEVANRARASKSTLYMRFENKEVLFTALIAWGTRQGTEALEAIVRDDTLDPLTALHRYAACLLRLMMQPDKLALFRIALGEGDRLPELGKIFSRFTRDHGVKLGHVLATRLVREGLIEIDNPDDYGHSFMGLLQGELYLATLLGTIPRPSDKAIEHHARRAMARLIRAFAPIRKSSRARQS